MKAVLIQTIEGPHAAHSNTPNAHAAKYKRDAIGRPGGEGECEGIQRSGRLPTGGF
jgi:hypothetical protein